MSTRRLGGAPGVSAASDARRISRAQAPRLGPASARARAIALTQPCGDGRGYASLSTTLAAASIRSMCDNRENSMNNAGQDR